MTADGRQGGDTAEGSPWFRPLHEAPQHETPPPAPPAPPAQPVPPVQPAYDPSQTPSGARVMPRRPISEAERAAARRRASGAPGDTAAMPVLDLEAVPSLGPVLDPEPVQQYEAPAVPPEGGRAARRKAAQEAARRGGRSRRAPEAPEAATEPSGPSGLAVEPVAGPAAEPAGRPLSRVEARRAAKAAKDSPAVVASRVMGEMFITVGVLMLLFVTYQLWWTNVLAHQEAGGAAKNLEKQWDGATDTSRDPGTFSAGQGFAIIYLPKLDVKAPIAEGVSKSKVLDKGMVGHYSGAQETAMPWDTKGNFALAAHRNTHGEPFRYINKLVKGDKIVVETESEYYTYEVTSSLASTPPSNTSVIKPIPTGSGFTTAGRYITLTTCTPEFTSKYRLIVWGKMVDERPRSKGKPDALVE
ncbi:class E sortase [Streptomyces sp. NBC_01262]|uniref:class E sortase n=1 Tax=Streptomyces sp. NBC_01262 TaxID=2903803 RepID=UPI002E375FB3|nr:class E sortase [Streptomyces sp. NBC_01262]